MTLDQLEKELDVITKHFSLEKKELEEKNEKQEKQIVSMRNLMRQQYESNIKENPMNLNSYPTMNTSYKPSNVQTYRHP